MRISNIKIEDGILLKKAARDGCSDSLGKIYSKYMPSLFNYLKNKAPHQVIAEDIAQDVFQAILEGKCSYDGSSDPLSYLIGVGRVLLKKELSKENIVVSSSMPDDCHDIFTDNDSDKPIGSFSRSEFMAFLFTEISKLSNKLQMAIELVYIDERTYAEAAKESGCTYDTMRKRTRDALVRLKMKIFPCL